MGGSRVGQTSAAHNRKCKREMGDTDIHVQPVSGLSVSVPAQNCRPLSPQTQSAGGKDPAIVLNSGALNSYTSLVKP